MGCCANDGSDSKHMKAPAAKNELRDTATLIIDRSLCPQIKGIECMSFELSRLER